MRWPIIIILIGSAIASVFYAGGGWLRTQSEIDMLERGGDIKDAIHGTDSNDWRGQLFNRD